MMILNTPHALGPWHGFGIVRRMDQSESETSDNNRKTRFYSITWRGLRELRSRQGIGNESRA
jgi:hypothetical protein